MNEVLVTVVHGFIDIFSASEISSAITTGYWQYQQFHRAKYPQILRKITVKFVRDLLSDEIRHQPSESTHNKGTQI